jgi:uracil-DNA glycosylase
VERVPDDPAEELRELAANLTEWLRYQRRLGWRGTAGGPAAASASEAAEVSGRDTPTLEEIRREMGRCRRCKLYPGAKNLVFGEGSPRARLMFIGEAPGAEEDLQGRPFVGPAGQLLNRMLQKLGLEREEVYITNVVKSRPPGNREPEPEEIEACLPFLLQQIKAVRPRVIVTLGRVASQSLLGSHQPLTRLRGRWQRHDHIRVMPTFHPSYLLRFPRERQKTWEDMQRVMEYLTEHEED